MTRRSRSRFPGMARLASGVVLGGVGLGLLISFVMKPEMKQPDRSADLNRQDPAYPAREEAWLNAGIGLPSVSGASHPDFDRSQAVGADWRLDGGMEPAPPLPPLEQAEEVTAAAALEAVAPPAPERASPTRKSPLTQGGLY